MCVSGVGSERGERERLRTIRPRLVARRGTSKSRRPRMATRRSEAGHVWQRGDANRIETIRIEPRFGRNETIRGHVWHEAQRYGPRLACVGVLFLLWDRSRRSLSRGTASTRKRPGPTLNHERERALAHVPQGSHRSFDTHGFTERWSPKHIGTPKVRGCSYTTRRKASASVRKSGETRRSV